MLKHTEGPWRVRDNGSMEGPHVYGPVHPVDGGDYAPLAGYRGGALSMADARLIAAAPELLAMVKDLATVCLQLKPTVVYKNDPLKGCYIVKLLDEAETLIAKAQGIDRYADTDV